MANCKHLFVSIQKTPFESVYHCIHCHEEFDELPKAAPKETPKETPKEAPKAVKGGKSHV